MHSLLIHHFQVRVADLRHGCKGRTLKIHDAEQDPNLPLIQPTHEKDTYVFVVGIFRPPSRARPRFITDTTRCVLDRDPHSRMGMAKSSRWTHSLISQSFNDATMNKAHNVVDM